MLIVIIIILITMCLGMRQISLVIALLLWLMDSSGVLGVLCFLRAGKVTVGLIRGLALARIFSFALS